MQPFLETLGVVLLSIIGLLAGVYASRLRTRCWLSFYFVTILLVLSVAVTRKFVFLAVHAPFSWVISGRNEFAMLALSVPMMFGALIPKLKQLREKILIGILLFLASSYCFVYPFLAPVFVRQRHEQMETFIAPDGVCFQRYSYDCGPAAAVTALWELGVLAEEGPIALAAYTTPIYGTTENLLSDAINKLYGPDVVSCFRFFKTIDEINGLCPVIAVVKYAFFTDHYITVIEVQQDKVIVGDPLKGRVEMARNEFKNKWRFSGIVVERTGGKSQ